MHYAQRLYSVVFWGFFAVSSAFLFGLALVIFLVTLPFDRNGRLLHLFSCFWGQLYFYVNPFWRLQIEGRRHLPWRGAAVLVANHASLGDILVLYGLYRPFKWVSKASVFKVPFIGWNMRLNRYVGLERGDRRSILAMMRTSRAWLERGVPLMIFPEGTRTPDGEVQAFRDGAFRLARDAGVPVVPIVVVGTDRTLPKHGFVLRGRANCRVRVLEPVDPSGFDTVPALREHVRGLIVEEKRRLEGTAEALPLAA